MRLEAGGFRLEAFLLRGLRRASIIHAGSACMKNERGPERGRIRKKPQASSLKPPA